MIVWLLLAGLGVVALPAFFWPRWGLLARWQASLAWSARVHREDALKHILKCEANQEVPTLISVAGALQKGQRQVAALLADMEAHGLVSFSEGRLRLREPGRELALHIIRAHRLWESYLADQTGVAEAEWHRQADRQEHLLSPQQTDALAASLGNPTRDPHGDAIPEATGDLPAEPGQPLGAIEVNTPVMITHVEDEPEAIYAQLTAQGLRAGMKVCVLDKSPERIRFWADGREHVLAPIFANNIAVSALREFRPDELFEEEYLAGLHRGQVAKVLGLSPACRGAERRRLLDLGFVPGTEVAVDLVSPTGDPTAYRVRGTVVALRREQAGLVRIATERQAAA